ncbi:hypothetical protein B0J17DRAFT_684850 [Rhizoctonia solani]|nr:hypothetical protein B0J17DRAFT_684850 [Rhizoctonia solani]
MNGLNVLTVSCFPSMVTLINPFVGPHGPYTSSDEPLNCIDTLSPAFDETYVIGDSA